MSACIWLPSARPSSRTYAAYQLKTWEVLVKRLYSILTAALCATLLLGGCGQTAENTAENLIESATGADVDLSDGSITVTDEEGNVTQSGTDVPLPASFPSDIPVPAGGSTISASDAGGQVIVMWSIEGLTESLFDAYVAQVKVAGYAKEEQSFNLSSGGGFNKSVTLSGNGKSVSITGTEVDGFGQIMVMIADA